MVDRESFLRKFLRDPERVGALSPATQRLAQTMAAATQEAYGCLHHGGTQRGQVRLFELGAGTGALTRALHDWRPIVVERDEAWAERLRREFPALEVRAECAMQTLRSLREPAAIVTSIPLLNNPESVGIKQLLAQRYSEGLIKFCVLYTYGWQAPLRGVGFRRGVRRSFVARSLPPASVWVYQ